MYRKRRKRGRTASQSLHAMHRSSPEGYLRRACSPRNRGEIGPWYRQHPELMSEHCDITYLLERIVDSISTSRQYLPASHGFFNGELLTVV